MTDCTPRLGLPYLVAGQGQKEVTHNEALNRIDLVAQAAVASRHVSAPPAAPADGDCYLVPAGATGDWAGREGQVAAWYGGWRFAAPTAGWRVWVADEVRSIVFDGTRWAGAAKPPHVAGTDPTAGHDLSLGFAVGQLWHNSARGLTWICRDNAVGAARWVYLNAVEVLGARHVAAGKTDADTDEATLYALSIPGDTLGPNDTLRVTVLWSFPNSATTKSLKIKVGGSTIFSNSATTAASLAAQAQLSNRGTLNAQIGKPTGMSSFGTNASGPMILAKDFGMDQDVAVTGQWGSAGTGGNSIVLESVVVEVLRG